MVEAGVKPGNRALGEFGRKLDAAVRSSGSLVCVGLDPDLRQFPARLSQKHDVAEAIVEFNTAIIEATQDLVCAYKPNLGLYVKYGVAGIKALVETRRRIPAHIPAILDCKVNDMASTSSGYARGYFDEWDFDAVTVNGYLGDDAVEPFLAYADRGLFFLCRTSNPGATTFQDLSVTTDAGPDPLYLAVADQIQRWADRGPATVGLVVGATYPAELAKIRERCPDLPILLPGIGVQGGDLEASLDAGLDRNGAGLLVSASRSVTYASQGDDFAEKAREETQRLHAAIAGARVPSQL